MGALNHMRTFILLAAMTALFMGVGYMIGGPGGMAIAFVVAIGVNVFSYWNSDALVLRAYQARPAADFAQDRRVQAYLEDTRQLAHRAGLPEPKIYVVDIPQPNAFATGRNPHHAAVVATTGLLSMLSREEVMGVMAHELAHVKNRDTLTMTVTATIAGAIGMLASFGMFFGGGRSRAGFIPMLIVALLAPMAAAIVQMAISRSREYEADRMGAEIAGNPLWLASALEKIAGGARRTENAPAENNPATAHMFIINPLSGKRADGLFSTHPATANRVSRLETLAATMGVVRRASPGASQGVSPGVSQGPWGERRAGPWG